MNNDFCMELEVGCEEGGDNLWRPESSFQDFRDFIADIGMGEIKFRGDTYTWANNREGAGVYPRKVG